MLYMIFLSRVAISEGLDGAQSARPTSIPSRLSPSIYLSSRLPEACIVSLFRSLSVDISSPGYQVEMQVPSEVPCRLSSDWLMTLFDITPTRLMQLEVFLSTPSLIGI